MNNNTSKKLNKQGRGRLKSESLKFSALAVVSICTVTSANAQVQFPVEAPTPKVGQIAKFRAVDLWNNKEISLVTNELVDVEANNFVVRFKRADRDTLTTLRFDRSWNICRSMKNSDKVACDGVLKFPMQIGAKYSFKERPWGSGQGYDSAACEVQGEEKVSVPAGSYDTLRVVCAGFWTRVFEGNLSGRFNETIWYAPGIGRAVKFQYNNFHSQGALDTKTQTELMEFVVGG